MKIRRLELQNFRCFKRQEIDLSADLVVLYGRNGTGKTAIFDAIEFCLTGEVARLQSGPSSQGYLVNAFDEPTAKVRVEFEGADENHWIEAAFDHNAWSARFSDASSSRREFFFAHLVDESYLPPRKEFGPLVDLFRSTALLSQTSMCDFINADPGHRSSLISNLVGAAYLQRCLDKAGDVFAEGEKRTRATRQDLEILTLQLRDLQAQTDEREGRLTALRHAVQGEPIHLSEIVDAYRAKAPTAEATPGIANGDANEIVASFSGFYEERLREIRTRLSEISALAEAAPLHDDAIRRRDALMLNVSSLRHGLSAARAEEQQLAEKLTTQELHLKELQGEVSASTAESTKIAGLREQAKRCARLKNELDAGSRRAVDLDQQLQKESEHVASAKAAADRLGKNSAAKSAELITLSERLSLFRSVGDKIPLHAERTRTHVELGVKAQDSSAHFEALARERERLLARHQVVRTEAKELPARLRTHGTSGGELEKAMLTLRSISRDGMCPLCGHEHGSEEAFDEAFNHSLTEVSSLTAKEQLAVRTLDEEIRTIHETITKLDAAIPAAQRERDEIQRQLAGSLEAHRQLEAFALANSVPLEPESLAQAIAAQEAATASGEAELLRLQAEAALKNSEAANSEALLKNLTEERDKLTEQLSKIRHELDAIAPQLPATQLPVEDWERSANSAEARRARSIVAADAQLSAVADLQRQLGVVRAESTRIGDNLRAAEKSLLTLTQQIGETATRLRALGSGDIAFDGLDRLRESTHVEEKELVKLQAQLQRFAAQARRSAVEGERKALALQAQSLKSRQQELEGRLQGIRNATAAAGEWRSSLRASVERSVGARLNRHRIESFRLFQAMIPTPYLFDDISIARESDGVRLGLKFRGVAGVAGEPRYFLSNAQANVLALSYFLSFAWRQQWFRLRTILMDDPVQHLDDLDAVALLDVVRALLLSPGAPRRQMIISTCDYNLYALMIRKFSSIQSDDVRFCAISLHDSGAGGPVLRHDVGGRVSAAAA